MTKQAAVTHDQQSGKLYSSLPSATNDSNNNYTVHYQGTQQLKRWWDMLSSSGKEFVMSGVHRGGITTVFKVKYKQIIN